MTVINKLIGLKLIKGNSNNNNSKNNSIHRCHYSRKKDINNLNTYIGGGEKLSYNREKEFKINNLKEKIIIDEKLIHSFIHYWDKKWHKEISLMDRKLKLKNYWLEYKRKVRKKEKEIRIVLLEAIKVNSKFRK